MCMLGELVILNSPEAKMLPASVTLKAGMENGWMKIHHDYDKWKNTILANMAFGTTNPQLYRAEFEMELGKTSCCGSIVFFSSPQLQATIIFKANILGKNR